MSTLTSLGLNNNLFTQWPDALCALHKLERLDVKINQLTVLPSCIGRLSDMQRLNLRSNNISVIAPIEGMNKLQQLWLGNNRIENLANLSLPELQQLWLDNNRFTFLPPLLLDRARMSKRLPMLRFVDVSRNNISADGPNGFRTAPSIVSVGPGTDSRQMLIALDGNPCCGGGAAAGGSDGRDALLYTAAEFAVPLFPLRLSSVTGVNEALPSVSGVEPLGRCGQVCFVHSHRPHSQGCNVHAFPPGGAGSSRITAECEFDQGDCKLLTKIDHVPW